MKMPDIISNSSCLIALDNIGMIDLLRDIYGKIYITNEVAQEVGIKFEDWVEIKPIKDKNYLKILNNVVDLGEASTIALSLEIKNNVMILDDLKARKLAKKLNLKFTGLLGILLKAKKDNKINFVQDILNKLKSAGFRFSAKMENEVLRLAEEPISTDS